MNMQDTGLVLYFGRTEKVQYSIKISKHWVENTSFPFFEIIYEIRRMINNNKYLEM